MAKLKKRKCKTCGNPFMPSDKGDWYCSALCRTAGLFVGGGGDTSKPMSAEAVKAMERKGQSAPSKKEMPSKERSRYVAANFPRVVEMYSLPVERRWEIAKTFTPEEAEFSRRMARKMLVEDRMISEIADWDGAAADGNAGGAPTDGGRLGDSDDGTV